MTEYVWGIDPAISRIAVAFAPVDGGPVEVRTLLTDSASREGQRLGWLDRQLRIAARQWAAEYPPACAWVEQPSGRFRNLALVYATGVVQAALFETLACPVWTMPSSTWKQRTVGVGNATKPQVLAWVTRLGVDVASQDEADAVAIACAGRAMLLAGSWEAVVA
jgi:Holliday junction resolvasome RuvABC endonuclease subunit